VLCTNLAEVLDKEIVTSYSKIEIVFSISTLSA